MLSLAVSEASSKIARDLTQNLHVWEGANSGKACRLSAMAHQFKRDIKKTPSVSCHAAYTCIQTILTLYTQKYELSYGRRGRIITAFGPSGGSCGPSNGPLRRAM